jgi:hypothetical protein
MATDEVQSLFSLLDPEDEGITISLNVGNYLPVDMTSHPTIRRCGNLKSRKGTSYRDNKNRSLKVTWVLGVPAVLNIRLP